MASSLEVIESEVDPRIVLESNLTATLDHITGEESPLGKELEGPVNRVVSKVVGGVAISKGIKDSGSSTVGIQITILLITIRSDVLEAVDDAEDFLSDLIIVLDHTFQAIGKAVVEGLADVLIEGVFFLLLHTNHVCIVAEDPACVKLGLQISWPVSEPRL
jgi:hypothetical protein